MKKSISTYIKKIWPLIAFLIFDYAGSALQLPVIRDFPLWIHIGLSLFVIFVVNFVVFHNIFSQLDRHEALSRTLVDLGELRADGVKLRNDAMKDHPIGWPGWVSDLNEWRSRVIDKLAELSASEAELFKTRDLFQVADFGMRYNDYAKWYFSMVSDETKDIKAIVERWQEYLSRQG